MNELAEFLKNEVGSRVSLGHRWLVFLDGKWVVYERLPYQKKTRVIESTENLSRAVTALDYSKTLEPEHGCPVCRMDWYDTLSSLCERHQDYILTVCDTCGRECFSDCKFTCIPCCPDSPYNYKGTGDPCALLRINGMDDTW